MLFVIMNGIGIAVNPCKAKQLFADQFTLFVNKCTNDSKSSCRSVP